MAEDPAAEQEMRQLEDRLREVGERLQAPPDDAEDLLNLLIEVEECLLKVEQSPPESTSNALRPATEALVKKELLGHADSNVRLGVASCISEITRITAPDAPYDDDAMKDVFSLIVGAFEHLDDIESPFFGRRTSILDTVAKVRSCVVMLDLECDDLINDMFHHFLRTVNSGHSEAVISCMETIMRLVIEESEDVQPQLASCLLQNVRKEEKESSSPSFELAEKVIDTCREKLKPVFLQSLKGTSLSEYSQIVASVCEEVSDDREDNNVDPSGKDTVDDGKLSERTISDELPQESSKAEQDVSRLEQDGTSMNGNTGTAISSGATPPNTGESDDQGPPSTKEKIEKPCNAENIADADQLKSDHNEGAESNASKPKKKAALDSDKSTKLKPSDKCEATVHSDADTKKEDLVASSEGTNGAADDTSRRADSTPTKPKRGRPPGPKSSQKKAAGKDQSSGLDLKKVKEAGDSAGKLAKRSAKDEKSSAKKASEGESSKKTQKNSSKQQKDETLSGDDPAKDLSLKEMISPKSSTRGPGRTKGQSTENSTPKMKQEQETEEPPRLRKSKGLDKSLVGARIKVWWPDDKMFYNGVVESFDSVSKRHKVAYNDGDVEVLLLRDEKWEFISEEKGASVASETPRGRKRKADAVKEENTETPKSDAVDPPKKRGRPKGVRSSNGTPSNSATPSTKGKTAGKDAKETPKTGPNLKKELEKSSKGKASVSTETKDELPKDDDKSATKPKEAISKGKDSKDEGKSTDGKARPGRKPKNAGTPAKSDADKEKRKEKEVKAAEIEQEASGNASTGKKRRRKA
ncbi:sister chromatid cohesion protein PDS5 homolog C-like isoform X2 [Miscanthus floridulus]|uniref:sister chromatid cohesion protein PDS5 homolog C-like isoform X2 n=1 Tax=Miscanthus floridulus TaxID=154761 RepID=UPI003457DA55